MCVCVCVCACVCVCVFVWCCETTAPEMDLECGGDELPNQCRSIDRKESIGQSLSIEYIGRAEGNMCVSDRG